MTALDAALGALATWRVTHLLHAEDGPGDLVRRFRTSLGTGWVGRGVGCFYCLSVWVAAPIAMAIADGWREGVLGWWAFSGAAILLERVTGREEGVGVRAAVWEEEGEQAE